LITEDRLGEIEFRIQKLHEITVDPKRTHFNHVILDYNLTRGEVNKLFGMMDEISADLDSLDEPTFEAAIGRTVSRLKGEGQFIDAVLRSLYEDGRYVEVYEKLRRS
jgi:hypothetical protein